MRDPIVTEEQITEGLGAFDELEYLGGGTFGDTYRAVRGDDEIALKVVHVEGLPDYLWKREVEALRRVEHPNVVGFQSSGTFHSFARDYSYLICEYIDGGDVAAAIAAGRLPESTAEMVELLTGLLAGVAEIHDLGILHRDIKPANVALRHSDWGQPVLLDFGLARLVDMSSHTELPAHIGTARYMAPEQLRGGAARRRSDLFAVAEVAYEAITGRHPFVPPGEAATLQALHDRIRDQSPEPASTFNAASAPEIDGVLARLLSYRPHERLGISAALKDMEQIHGDV